MTRKSFTISEEDFTYFWNYLNNNKPNLHIVLRSIIKPEHLHTLIIEELNATEIARMRSSVRMSKSRANKQDRQMKDVNITLSKQAHAVLAAAAAKQGMTLSETVIQHFSALLEGDAAKKVKKQTAPMNVASSLTANALPKEKRKSVQKRKPVQQPEPTQTLLLEEKIARPKKSSEKMPLTAAKPSKKPRSNLLKTAPKDCPQAMEAALEAERDRRRKMRKPVTEFTVQSLF